MTLLLLQMAIILLVTVTCGWLARRLGQARVIGEIIGGIIIGPSVFGRLAPELSAHFFNKDSAAAFDSLSTLGLILFLFLIGMELDYKQFYKQRGTALLASVMSILLPFTMAALLAHSLRIPIRRARHRECTFRSVPWHRHEHYRFPGSRPDTR
jgi:Kef-type K+ transport system membrane component KefB